MSFDYIRLHSGRKFSFVDPQPEDIHIDDICHALSLNCRYIGHCSDFYSVAEHSVRVSEILPDEFKLAGLTHDFAEAYVTDIPSPLKQYLPDFRAIEERVEKVIAAKYNLKWPMPKEVKNADMILLTTELRDLLGDKADDWKDLQKQGFEPLKNRIFPWESYSAKILLRSFSRELMGI